VQEQLDVAHSPSIPPTGASRGVAPEALSLYAEVFGGEVQLHSFDEP
jgi:hypothetical protein